jgi:hypothetical protein
VATAVSESMNAFARAKGCRVYAVPAVQQTLSGSLFSDQRYCNLVVEAASAWTESF